MAFGMKNILQGGFAANYSEASIEELNKEYGVYLMDKEAITMGFKLVRDALIFTDKRIIMTDKQGATGTKMNITSINLFSIIDVKMETSGFGFDDSELTFTYINSPELKGHHVTYASHSRVDKRLMPQAPHRSVRAPFTHTAPHSNIHF